MNPLALFGWAGLALLVIISGLWLISLRLRNTGIVDIFWGPGFIFLSWVYFLGTPEGFLPRKLLLCSMVLLWGLRLALHIFLRNKGKPEDFRYQAWRAKGGKTWGLQSYFKVFLLQGFLMWIISGPLLAAQAADAPSHLTWLDIAGPLLWAVGLAFETVGDVQLCSFKSDPNNTGRVLRQGLWRYSRHPNYFGDALQWWGFFLLAAATGAYWAVYSPTLMTVLLHRVSGVTLLEKTLILTKPGYQEYVRDTNAFFPWFPRNPQR